MILVELFHDLQIICSGRSSNSLCGLGEVPASSDAITISGDYERIVQVRYFRTMLKRFLRRHAEKPFFLSKDRQNGERQHRRPAQARLHKLMLSVSHGLMVCHLNTRLPQNGQKSCNVTLRDDILEGTNE